MSFDRFSFGTPIMRAIERCGFTVPTPIQDQAIGPVLDGRDVLGLAQTGTGKTAAFVLPVVQHLLKQSARAPRALIVAPTRELAEQIHSFAAEVTSKTSLRTVVLYGGVSKNNQIARLRGGADIVVACPGRLLDLVQDKAVDLRQVAHLVLDEADHMFDKGFLPDIRRIVKLLPAKRQSLLFSATMPSEIRHLAEELLQNPVTVQTDRIAPAKTVDHTLFEVEQPQKAGLLVELLASKELATTLVFTRTKHKAKNLAVQLDRKGFRAVALQGNMSQNRRQQALDGFKDGTYNVLVATDIAARGIDVSGISHVINFDMPDTAEAYIHRTGRTGRAAATGEAFTFATGEDDKLIRQIERALGRKLARRSGVVSVPAASVAVKAGTVGRIEKKDKDSAAGEHLARPAGQRRRSRTAPQGVFGLAARGRQQR